jgi:hypothetical protein
MEMKIVVTCQNPKCGRRVAVNPYKCEEEGVYKADCPWCSKVAFVTREVPKPSKKKGTYFVNL